MKRLLEHHEAVRALINMGFTQLPQKATSHTQWETIVDGVRYHVTLDAHNAPYHRDSLASICRQAGVTKKEMFAAIKRKGHPRAKPAETQPSPSQ